MKRKKNVNKIYYSKNIFYPILELLHVIVGAIYKCIFRIVTSMIYLATFERGTKGELTLRKANRIRRLTNFKLFVFGHFPILMKLFNQYDYLNSIHKKFEDGL